MIANLHPSHGTEPMPIHDACQVEHYAAEARAIVRNGLRLVGKPVECPRCYASANEPCVTASGERAKQPHARRPA